MNYYYFEIDMSRNLFKKAKTKPKAKMCELQLLQLFVCQKVLSVLKGNMVCFKIIWLRLEV